MSCFPFFQPDTIDPPVTPQFTDFQALFPELSTVTEDQFNFWMTQSQPMFNTQRWADLYFLGVLYWVAHSITLGTANATQRTTDDASMKKVGDIMKQRDSQMMNKQADNPYFRTNYGQMYLYYQGLVGAGAMSV